MSPRTLKLRTRRFWRRRAAQTLAVAHTSSEAVEKFGLSRIGHLKDSWRFVVVWVGSAVAVGVLLTAQIIGLRPYYQTLQPVPGGRYTEGIYGSFTTANPLYALSDVDTSVSRLLFAGLLRYDKDNRLVGDLADSWNVDPTGKVYTVHLRSGLRWQDGQPLTAADVAYTYHVIQNPDAQSPLYESWRGITVAAADRQDVTFTLANPLSSFPSSLTNGIVPEHALQGVDPANLQSASFNTARPIGSGPFRWVSIGISGTGDTQSVQITLAPFSHYWAGAPKLTSFSVYTYADSQAMIHAYQNNEITAMIGLDTVPADLAHDHASHIYNLPLLAGAYVFFRTTAPILNDTTVRQALTLAADRSRIIQTLGYQAVAVDEPLLKSQLGYDPRYAQVTGDLQRAEQLLDSDGWVLGSNGVRTKGGQALSFTLASSDTYEYRHVAGALQEQWSKLGVEVRVAAQPAADFQNTLSNHDYQAALYGITIGVDPDVYVYWDSSQADPRSATRLNFSEYKSSIADLALEAGRTRPDPALRAVKYQAFLKAWQADTPALALYQPRLLYISHEKIYGLDTAGLPTDADRFRNVQNWMIHLGWVTRP